MRKRRNQQKVSKQARKAALKRWEKHWKRPADPEIVKRLAAHPLILKGDPIGSLEWRDFRSGEIHRWTILRGDRVDRVILRSPDGRRTNSHGWTWILNHLRGFLAGTKAVGKPRPLDSASTI